MTDDEMTLPLRGFNDAPAAHDVSIFNSLLLGRKAREE
jgi:hypothetical protein